MRPRRRRARALRALRLGLATLVATAAACGPAGTAGVRLGAPEDSAAGMIAPRPDVLKVPPLRVRSSPGLEEVARRIATDPVAWRPFPGLGEAGAWISDTVALFVVRNLSELTEEGLARPERWVAGTADPAGRRIALRAGSELEPLSALRVVFRHELAHLLVHAAAGERAPRWLHEGYAQLASGAWSWGDAWRIQLALFRGGAGTLRDVDLRFRSNAEEVRLAYLLSFTVVQELWDAGGDPGLGAFFRSLAGGESVDGALRRVYGVTLEQFEKRWRTSVMDRYGWLYLLSRAGVFWLLVTLLVLFVSLRRARSDRRRLAEMRAQEGRGEEAPWWPEPEPFHGEVDGGPGAGSHEGPDTGTPFVDDEPDRG